jgi:hypothetical protein
MMNRALAVLFGAALVLAYVGGEWHGRREAVTVDKAKAAALAAVFALDPGPLTESTCITWPASVSIPFGSSGSPAPDCSRVEREPDRGRVWACGHDAAYATCYPSECVMHPDMVAYLQGCRNDGGRYVVRMLGEKESTVFDCETGTYYFSHPPHDRPAAIIPAVAGTWQAATWLCEHSAEYRRGHDCPANLEPSAKCPDKIKLVGPGRANDCIVPDSSGVLVVRPCP